MLQNSEEFQEVGADLFSCDGVSFALALNEISTETKLLNIIARSSVVIFARLSPA